MEGNSNWRMEGKVDWDAKLKGKIKYPSTRDICLLAVLNRGWNVRSNWPELYPSNRNSPIDDELIIRMAQVVGRSQQLENTENDRIGRLVERLENIKKSAIGKGLNDCVLCGEMSFIYLLYPLPRCEDCQKVICGTNNFLR